MTVMVAETGTTVMVAATGKLADQSERAAPGDWSGFFMHQPCP